MNSNIKPFRIVNDLELKQLHAKIEQNIFQWNEQYARHPLQCKLERCLVQDLDLEQFCAILAGESIQALIQKDYFHMVQTSIFGVVSNDFDEATHNIFHILCGQFLGFSAVDVKEPPSTPLKNLLYTGSPVLSLHIFSKECPESICIILHPEWVLKALPSAPRGTKKIINPEHLIELKSFALYVDLKTIKLPLQQLFKLKPEDVIKTGHFLNESVFLKINDTPVFSVEIGESNQNKSIQIKGTL